MANFCGFYRTCAINVEYGFMSVGSWEMVPLTRWLGPGVRLVSPIVKPTLPVAEAPVGLGLLLEHPQRNKVGSTATLSG
jgi:hypothetical protein